MSQLESSGFEGTMLLSFSLLIPSMATIQKYLGVGGAILYALLGGTLVYCGYVLVQRVRVPIVGERAALRLLAVTWITLFVVFRILYPLANSGALGPGSDRDDALEIGTRAVLRGEYPYYLRTYLQNPISPLPGAMILAVPFVLLGNSAYQNLFWLLLFVIMCRSFTRSWSKPLFVFWVVLVFSPSVMRELVTGGDLLANSIYVIVFMLWLVKSAQLQNRRRWQAILSAVLLGIGLSSRLNFIFLLPLAFATLVRLRGWRYALFQCGIVCLVFFMVTLPYYLYDPHGFSPLHTAGKLGQFRGVLPHPELVIVALTGIVTLYLSSWRGSTNLSVMFGHGTIVLAIPIMCAVVLSSVQRAALDFRMTSYGLSFLFCGVIASLAIFEGTDDKH